MTKIRKIRNVERAAQQYFWCDRPKKAAQKQKETSERRKKKTLKGESNNHMTHIRNWKRNNNTKRTKRRKKNHKHTRLCCAHDTPKTNYVSLNKQQTNYDFSINFTHAYSHASVGEKKKNEKNRVFSLAIGQSPFNGQVVSANKRKNKSQKRNGYMVRYTVLLCQCSGPIIFHVSLFRKIQTDSTWIRTCFRLCRRSASILPLFLFSFYFFFGCTSSRRRRCWCDAEMKQIKNSK